MKSHKRIVKIVAKNHGLDSDELLIILWDFPRKKFDYLDSQNNVIKQKDYRLVKKIIKSKFEIVEKTEKISKIVPRVEFIYREYNFSLIGVKKVDLGAYMNKDEILMIYQELVLDFDKFKDPIQPSGLKEEALLESAIFHPQTSYEKQAKYPTVESSAAALMYSLSQNHAFHNGNKRTAMVSMLIFLDKHNMCITSNEDDLFKISLELADHRLVDDKYLCADAEIFALSKWIHSNCKTMKKGERPITLKKFKQILTHFDCTFLNNGKVNSIQPLAAGGDIRFKSGIKYKYTPGFPLIHLTIKIYESKKLPLTSHNYFRILYNR